MKLTDYFTKEQLKDLDLWSDDVLITDPSHQEALQFLFETQKIKRMA